MASAEHFPRLPQLLADQHGLMVSADTVMELVHDVGGHLEAVRRVEAQRGRPSAEAIVLRMTPSRVLIEVDGTMSCTNQRESDSAHPVQIRLPWQQMKVGAVAWQDDTGRWHKQFTWGRESPQEFGAALHRLACQYGYEQAAEKLFVADGADWCWEIQATFFSATTPIVDWYHVSEHVWNTARVMATDKAVDGWAHAALDQFHTGDGTSLMNWLDPQQKTHRGRKRQALDTLLNYLRPRGERLEIGRIALAVGPSAVGSSSRVAAISRVCSSRATACTGPNTALAITALRVTNLNGQWHSTWNQLALAT